MKKISLLFLFCYLSVITHAQLTFTTVLEPTLGYHPDNWEFMSDGHGQYYLKQWDEFLNQQWNKYLIHSADGGTHWSMVSNKAGRRHFIGLDGNVYVAEGQSVQRSTDHGLHFDTLSIGIVNPKNLAVTENGGMLFSNQSGIYYSDNQGLNWTQVGNEKNLTLKVLPGLPDVWGWTVQNNVLHLWHSSSPGQNWVEIFSAPYTYYQERKTNLYLSQDGTLYFVAGTDFNRVLRSEDQGASWTETSVHPNTPWEITSFAVSASGELLVRMNNNNWYHSTDQGLSYQPFQPSWQERISHALSTLEGDVFGSGNSILSKYQATGEWDFAAFGLAKPVQIAWPSDSKIQMRIMGGVITLENGVQSFASPQDSSLGLGCSSFFLDGNGGHYNNQCEKLLLHSSDLGLPNDTIFRESNKVSPSETMSSFQRNGDTIRILTGDYLYSSFNAGKDWIHSLSVPGFHSWDAIAVSSNGRVYVHHVSSIWRSDDNGITLQPTGTVDCCISTLQCVQDNEVVMLNDDELRVSTDHGLSWQPIATDPLNGNGQLGINELNNFTVLADKKMFAAGRWNGVGSVFYSPDFGQTWQISPVGEGNCRIVGIGKDKYLYVSLSGSVVFPYTLLRSEQKIDALVETKAPLFSVDKFKLSPNPATSAINITGFNEQEFSACIFNQTGQVFASYPHLNTSDEINIGFLPAGTYFIKVNTGTGLWCGKLIKI